MEEEPTPCLRLCFLFFLILLNLIIIILLTAPHIIIIFSAEVVYILSLILQVPRKDFAS